MERGPLGEPVDYGVSMPSHQAHIYVMAKGHLTVIVIGSYTYQSKRAL